jgi:hypothetical protein
MVSSVLLDSLKSDFYGIWLHDVPTNQHAYAHRHHKGMGKVLFIIGYRDQNNQSTAPTRTTRKLT